MSMISMNNSLKDAFNEVAAIWIVKLLFMIIRLHLISCIKNKGLVVLQHNSNAALTHKLQYILSLYIVHKIVWG
jgi:hypothetical protein